MKKLVSKITQVFHKNKTLPKLTIRQDAFKNTILSKLQEHKSFLWNTEYTLFDNRQTGKTFLINDIGLELQSIGYKVWVISQHNLEYMADYFTKPNDIKRGLGDIVILFDDVEVNDIILSLPYLKYGFVRNVDFNMWSEEK